MKSGSAESPADQARSCRTLWCKGLDRGARSDSFERAHRMCALEVAPRMGQCAQIRNLATERGFKRTDSSHSCQKLLNPAMQWARAREMRQQELHLVRQDAAALQEDVLGVVGREGDGEELHA